MYFIIAGALLLISIVLLVQFGIRPRPVPKIKLSGFESTTHIAQALRYRLHEEIKVSQFIILGVNAETPEHFEIWKNFLLSLDADLKYESLLIESELPDHLGLSGVQKLKMIDDFDDIVAALRTAMQSHTRVAILVPTVYSSMLVKNNFAHRLQEDLLMPIMTISLNEFARKRDEEANLKPPCIGEGVDETGTGPLGCMILTTSRNNYRTASEGKAFDGLVNQVGLYDYLVLIKKN